MPLGMALLCSGRLETEQVRLWLTWGPLEVPAAALLRVLDRPELPPRRVCSWSNSRSSRRWVSPSFCWIAIRNRELRVFFSSSAAASCRCISSSWVTYSSQLQNRQKREKTVKLGEIVDVFSNIDKYQLPKRSIKSPMSEVFRMAGLLVLQSILPPLGGGTAPVFQIWWTSIINLRFPKPLFVTSTTNLKCNQLFNPQLPRLDHVLTEYCNITQLAPLCLKNTYFLRFIQLLLEGTMANHTAYTHTSELDFHLVNWGAYVRRLRMAYIHKGWKH